MKKLLLSFVSAFIIFSLSAQVTDNFSDYTVGGKLALQAQEMGRDYWTTWSGVVGGTADGVIADMSGNKTLHLTFNNDQVLKLGEQSSGVWTLTFKIFIPTGKDGYFNVLDKFPASANGDWAFQCGFAYDTNDENSPYYPGIGKLYAGSTTCINFNFTHDTWISVKVIINLDDDVAGFYINDALVHEWIYSLASFGDGCPRIIDALNIYPPSSTALSDYYIDDIAFASESAGVIFEANFDELPNNSYLAESYPEFWETWGEAPGTDEDALITNAQSSSNPNSAKCTPGTDVIFLAGDKTSGVYTLDFDMYIPNSASAYFNLLHIFDRADDGQASEWAVDVYFNVTASGWPQGTNVMQNDILTPFTFPSNTWFPVSFYINLDDDIAKLSINGSQILEWQYSNTVEEEGGTLQLAGADFYPPQANSTFYIDNFKFVSLSNEVTFPIMDVTPDKISTQIALNSTLTETVTVSNSGTSIGTYYSWMEYDVEPVSGSGVYTLLHHEELGEDISIIGYSNIDANIEVGAKFKASQLCDKVGSKITKLSYFVAEDISGSIIFRVYGPLANNKPGELLAEVELTDAFVGDWNEVTLPTPLLINKSEYWITVEMYHASGAHPISVDAGDQGGPGVPGANWIKMGSGSWSEFTNWGNILIEGTAQGGVVPSCWISTTGDTYCSVLKDNSKTFNVALNSAGLVEGDYKAKINVSTSDTEHPLFIIPITMKVSDSIASNNANLKEITADGIVATWNAGVGYYQINNFTMAANKEVEIVVTPEHNKATVTGDIGKQPIKAGTNNYNFTITAEDGVTSKNFKLNILAKEEGISEINNLVKLYPNPVIDYLHLDIQSELTINHAFIYDFTGKMVKQIEHPGNSINLSDLPAGLYILKATSSKGEAIHKFTKR